MTSKPKESINCIYYVNMTIATDPINPNNIIQFTKYNNTHTLTLLIVLTTVSSTNKQSWWLRQLVHSKIESNNSHEYHNPIPTQYDYHDILTPSSAIIYCIDAIYIPSLGAALLCWLWVPLTDYCVLAILRRFLALRSLYLKHLNRFRVQLILMFY